MEYHQVVGCMNYDYDYDYDVVLCVCMVWGVGGDLSDLSDSVCKLRSKEG